MKQVFLSPPWTGRGERAAVMAAFNTGYVAPCGPCVNVFEAELRRISGRRFAVALSSGTAALALVAEHLGVGPGWIVVAPTLTFIATVAPMVRRGASLLFVDSGPDANIDPELLDAALAKAVRRSPGKTLFVSVDLYGRCCPYATLAAICARRGAVWISDSAEAVGAECAMPDGSRVPAGSAALAAAYSFNGNKIITTSGGGAVVTDDRRLAEHVRKLSTQSREPVPWYEHRELGFNCRMSNILAAIGAAQAAKLPEILRRRRANRRRYAALLEGSPLRLLPPVAGENCWLNVAIAPSQAARDATIAKLAAAGLEARPVWKPMHLQPVFKEIPCEGGGGTAARLFRRGVCLPSGTGLDFGRVANALR